MVNLLFGTGGVPHSARTATTIDGIERIAELGLGCMEMEFVQGVKMGEAGARLVAETARRSQIKLSAHAPYFINLNSHDMQKLRASQERLLQTARIATLCGADTITFHPAFYLGDPPETVFSTVKKYLGEVLDRLERENNKLLIRPEVMGKPSQFGTVDELVRLSAELEGVAPCIDFSHWHARTGRYNSYPEFASILSLIKEGLGEPALKNMHIHVSGIAYSGKGEQRHLNLTESDLNYIELLKAMKDYEVGGMVICESPSLEEDAMLLKRTYQAL